MGQGILDEIENDTDRAIDTTVNDLPLGFPERIVSSIIEGLRRRLRLFAHAAASARAGIMKSNADRLQFSRSHVRRIANVFNHVYIECLFAD
jgi:hypothetical protein